METALRHNGLMDAAMVNRELTLCICGGGGLGTVIAGVAASKGYKVNILTGHPENWNQKIEVYDRIGNKYISDIDTISANASEVIPKSDIILLCLPGSVIYSQLIKIKPYLHKSSIVGSVFSCTGFFITAISVLGKDARLFGFQRVPFIARVKEYGHSAMLLDSRRALNIAFWKIHGQIQTYFVGILSDMLCTPINVMDHALQATLTNSNPILHPSRLYSLFKDFDIRHPFSNIPCFYEDWTDDSSRILIACDREFQTMLHKLGLASQYTLPLLEYYESSDTKSLTRKIISIESLKGLKVPMTICIGGYAPDWCNRYFTEDIPYGLLLIKYVCQLNDVLTPNIDMIITWYQSQVGKCYLVGDKISDSDDIKEIACLNSESLQVLFQSIKV